MTLSQRQQDQNLFNLLLKKLKKTYNITIKEIFLIIEYCFGGQSIPRMNYNLYKTNKVLRYKYISLVLDINLRELIKAFNRAVGKLKEIPALIKARKQSSFTPKETILIKDKYGVHRQVTIQGDENNE